MKSLEHLHTPLPAPRKGEWLAEHKEPGQTFGQFLRSKPTTPAGNRQAIYLQPVGPFTVKQRKIISLTAEYIGLYFDRTVQVREPIRVSTIPANARRVHPRWRVEQVLTSYILYDVLKPQLPDDAAVYIALTATDLWPGEGWNFVFGQASFRDRVGVWSIYRNGDPEESVEAYRLCLRRTLKTATHEIGHMFSIKHCTANSCNMCGSNHREESDLHPLYLCHECVAKVLWATKSDPINRFQKLYRFCKQHGLQTEARIYYLSAKALSVESE